MDEDLVDFSEDPLEGQQICSIPVMNPSDYASAPTRIFHMGRNPLEETLGILGELLKAHFNGHKNDDVISSDSLTVRDKKHLMEINARLGFQRKGTPR